MHGCTGDINVIGRNTCLDYLPASFKCIVYYRYSLTAECVLKRLRNHLRDRCSLLNVRLNFCSGMYTSEKWYKLNPSFFASPQTCSHLKHMSMGRGSNPALFLNAESLPTPSQRGLHPKTKPTSSCCLADVDPGLLP